MNMKKGFTLVELLAVIVVLGLLVTIVIPIVSDTVEESRQKAFLTEAKNVYNLATMKVLDMVSTNSISTINSKGATKLDLEGNELDYCITINEDGEITSVTVSNGKYIIQGNSNFKNLDVTSVTLGNMNSYTCN